MDIPIEDRVAIQELAFLYALYCDTHQFDKMANLFTDDCIYDETCAGVERVTGKAHLLLILDYIAEQLGPVMHSCSNHLISDYSGSSARGICYVQAEGMRSNAGGGTAIRVLGYYDDVYAKRNGAWHFKERVLRPLVPVLDFPIAGGISYDARPRQFATRSQG